MYCRRENGRGIRGWSWFCGFGVSSWIVVFVFVFSEEGISRREYLVNDFVGDYINGRLFRLF